jgi:ketosteroid isomerase-like protein
MTEDERKVLQVNAAFYEAFCRRDMEGMDKLWAREHEIAVVHPGWQAVYGRDDVLASWHGILQSPGSPDIACTGVRVFVTGDVAFVICTEKLLSGDLIATNVFIRESSEWKLIHHHAGPTATDDASSAMLN